MKTAISVPDPLFQRGEDYAAQQAWGRSELYVRALEEFLERHAAQSITDQLDALYGEQDSTLPPEFEALSDEQLKVGFEAR